MTIDFTEGQIFLVDKPREWTSFDVVAKLRNTLRIKKVGHAGTLDPLATGLLVIATGKQTRQLHHLQDADKTYEAVFRLGAVTRSYDCECPPEDFRDTAHLTREQVEQAMSVFQGAVEQKPPAYSAVRVKGKRAYELARRDQEVELPTRSVIIHDFTLLAYPGPEAVEARIHCSKGTYIRSLIHDLGQQLGVGAYLLELRRTSVGPYQLDAAWSLPELVEQIRTAREAAAPERGEG